MHEGDAKIDYAATYTGHIKLSELFLLHSEHYQWLLYIQEEGVRGCKGEGREKKEGTDGESQKSFDAVMRVIECCDTPLTALFSSIKSHGGCNSLIPAISYILNRYIYKENFPSFFFFCSSKGCT